MRLIDADGENVGTVSTEDAIKMAVDIGLDLVEISPGADPPVCKLLDYGKYKYEAQKKANEARKKQKTIDVKEIKMRPSIDAHDYDVKMRSMRKFLTRRVSSAGGGVHVTSTCVPLTAVALTLVGASGGASSGGSRVKGSVYPLG